ncbi:hypothetical protein VNO77_02847 [Canavalia gladiata]|uniref:Uncharacterized protein n=1 Tax=Canavalia gladiata TaxID=3824 RepID=A0AAN9MYY0_CANGL
MDAHYVFGTSVGYPSSSHYILERDIQHIHIGRCISASYCYTRHASLLCRACQKTLGTRSGGWSAFILMQPSKLVIQGIRDPTTRLV